MLQCCEDMQPSQFIEEVREDDINILHHCASHNNFDALEALSTLHYFDQVINDDHNEAGWTPLLTACA